MDGLCSPKTIKELLKSRGLAPLKKLGQNFLMDENIVEKIADSAVGASGNILEIGPGLGALTNALAARSRKVVAVEIDRGMVETLSCTLADRQNVTIIHQDILKTDLRRVGQEQFGGEPFAVAGNLPYYITSKCLLHVLEAGAPVESFTAMVQKEVAERLAAGPGEDNYGAITASVAYYGKAELLFTVKPDCFLPRPDVESAVVKLVPGCCFDVDRGAYSKVVRGLFAMRRKTIANNLKASFGVNSACAEDILEACGLSAKMRAEELVPESFVILSKIMIERGILRV